MATANVISEIAGLEDLITAGKAFLMMSNKPESSLAVGSTNDETGTYYDGAAYQSSVTFVGTIAGKGMVLMGDDGKVTHIRIWPATAIPTGSFVTACAKYLEDPADDGDSADNAFGKTSSYYKYTFTY